MQPPKVWAAAVISVLDFFFVQHFDNPRGVPDRYGIVWHILRDHGRPTRTPGSTVAPAPIHA